MRELTADQVVSDIIRHLEYTYTSPTMVGLALRLRARLAEFRATGVWESLSGPVEPKDRPYLEGEPR